MKTITRFKQKAAMLSLFAFCFFAFAGLAGADVLLDNGASGTSSTGTWTASTGAGYYGVNSLYARPSATYTWQYTSQPAGTYEVLLWWTQTDTRGDSVAVSIATADGPVAVTINQQTNGGQWNSLGTFNLASSASVTITASSQTLSDGRYVSTSADAVWFRQVSSGDPVVEQVKDNGDSGTSSTGTWSPSSGANPYGTDSLYARPTATYTWQFDSLTPGTYEVFMWWTAATSRGSAIPVDINGLETVTVNQLTNGGQWNSLGTYSFNTSGYVTITAVGTTSTCADAVRLVSVDLNGAPTASIDAISPNPAGFDAFVAFSGHGTAFGGATITAYSWESSIDGLLGTEASFSAGPLSLGTHTISFTVTDSNGEISAVAQRELVIEQPVIIIDNGGAGTSSTGTWSVSTGGPNPYGANSLFARPTATYTWQFASQPAGLYDVYIWYTATTTRASAVPVNINGLETVTIDQRTGGGQWNYLGSYTFNGSGYVMVTAVGTASTCADAVRFEYVSGNNSPTAQITSITPSPALSGEPVSFAGQGIDADGSIAEYSWSSSIDGQLSDQASFNDVLSIGVHEISFSVRDNEGNWSQVVTQSLTVEENLHTVASDNGGAGTSFTGTWSVSTQPNFYGTSSLYARDGATYTWQFNPPVTAGYTVNMWWTAYAGRSNNVPVDIAHAGGTQRVYVNQQLNGGQWNALGQYQFVAGTTYTVTITAPAGTASTSADAVQFVQIPSTQAPVADFSANPTGGVTPVLVEFTDLSTGNIDSWLWNFGDGATSTQQSPTHQYATGGNYNVSLTVSNGFGSDTETKSNFIQVAGSSVENIYFAIGWGTTYGLWQNLEWDIADIGAVEISPDVWRYTNQAKGVTYYIRPIDTVAAFEDAIREPGAHIIYNGHSNYGYGLGFLLTHQQSSVRYFDDPLISNVSTDFTAPSISGLMFGQAFPNWNPVYQNGQSAIMPYDFGDPRGLPPYNYYATYTLPGDPTHYRIETADGSYVQRFPDSGRPAWYSANGSPPDPVLNPQYFITNPSPDFPHVTYVGTWPWASPGDWHVELYNGQTYQYHGAGSGANTATFYVVVPSAGSYNVYATWYPQAANATNTPYRIQHGSLSAPTYTTVLANQEVGVELNLLGTFVYNEAGMYTIEVSDAANGTVIADSVQLQYANDPASYVSAEFSSSVLEGTSPLTVQFVNQSSVYLQGVRRPTVTYQWNFGDGTTGTERDPMHTYTSAGIYTVSLTTTNQNGTSDTEAKQAHIHVDSAVPAAPRAQFFARSFSGTLPRSASFYDQSKGNVTGWLWNFGDGQTSTERNPTHTYTTGGPFTVSLAVTGPGGTDTITKTSYAYTIVGSRIVDNTDQYKYHYGGIYSGSYIGRAIMDARPVTVPNEEMRYSRFFFNGCVSESYYLPKFTRGVVFYTLDNRDDLLDPSADYIVEYLLGATDDEILEVINSVNYIHGYFDFNQLPPSMR